MQTFVWILVLLTLLHFPTNANPPNKYRTVHDSSLCTKVQRIKEDHVIPRSKIVRESFKRFCVAIPPICTYHRYKLVNQNETVTVEKSRLTYECCPGFEKQNNSCIPVCRFGCDNGECVQPDVCQCEAGWRGHNCSEHCEPNRYGKGCKENCTCQHGARCDRKTGFCYCTLGYTGTYCELPCPDGTYGLNCNEECECENGGLCDIVDGYCECQPGYKGDYCEDKCKPGTHGQDCEEDCVCIDESTVSCSHVDGKCICKPGYTGESCERECSNSTYGPNCNETCNCENANYCDPVDGECYCDPGWTGDRCEQKCPTGYFGDDCYDMCAPCINKTSTCNHVTGFCDCPPGNYGETCENACPKDYWGSNCTEKCICSENGTCNMTTGECICPPGWIGNCSEPCSPGTFGNNCSSECNCNLTKLCDAVTGSCVNSTHNKTGELKGGRTNLEKFGIGFSIVIVFGLVFFGVYYAKYYLRPTVRKWWNRENISDTGASRENIVDITFRNPLYDRPEAVPSSNCATERSNSFIDISSTILDRLSSISVKETVRASSCDTVLENDFIPETVKDFNTAENIIGNLSADAGKKDDIRKLD